jgi:hypothetical protein
MNKLMVLPILLGLFIAACSGPADAPVEPAAPTTTLVPTTAPASTAAPESEPDQPAAPPIELATPAVHKGELLLDQAGTHFSGSGTCAMCHSEMVDEAGTDVSIDTFWRSTMMANAARDPYWQASVREEIQSHPAYQAVIEDTCATCHMPMARFTAAAAGKQGQIFESGFLDPAHELHPLALDGVSCTLCHQIEQSNLGEESSFNGGFSIDPDLPTGERVNYGPFPVKRGLAQLMQQVSGFIPVESLHVKEAELCATCHTLYTPTIDANGEIVGQFPEQTPYLEWLNSDYQDTLSCQGCHMPEAEGGVVLSTMGRAEPRSPFSRHEFVGGNAYMLTILPTFGEELGVTASTDQFNGSIERVKAQLQNRTATVELTDVSRSEGQLTATVLVTSQTGHKFPTGFPSRRSWLHLTLQDANGAVIFESGGFDQVGLINGNDNDADPAAYEPHYSAITDPGQVQIYEAIIQDSAGNVTTTLLKGAGYLKDNRLLPAGFNKATAPADVAVAGQAGEDQDFLGGEDQVQYVIELGGYEGPFTLTAELLYQSIGYRWVENLAHHEGPEIERFLRYNQTVPNVPLVVSRTTQEIE